MPDAPKLRGEERDAELRAQLVPLAPGERPLVITACAVLCGLIAVANVVLWATGWDVRGGEVSAVGALIPAALFAVLAVGLWRTRLLAVAGMQTLLAITAIFASGALLVSSNVVAALLSLVIVVGSGALFWPLIRINGRIGARDRLQRGSTVEDHG